MFENAREKYKDTEYKMLVAKLIDKYNLEELYTQNKIEFLCNRTVYQGKLSITGTDD